VRHSYTTVTASQGGITGTHHRRTACAVLAAPLARGGCGNAPATRPSARRPPMSRHTPGDVSAQVVLPCNSIFSGRSVLIICYGGVTKNKWNCLIINKVRAACRASRGKPPALLSWHDSNCVRHGNSSDRVAVRPPARDCMVRRSLENTTSNASRVTGVCQELGNNSGSISNRDQGFRRTML